MDAPMLLEKAANRKAAAEKRAAREAQGGGRDTTIDEPKRKKPPVKVRGWEVHCQAPKGSNCVRMNLAATEQI